MSGGPLGEFEPPDTITREEYRRSNGVGTVNPPPATPAIGRGVGSKTRCEFCMAEFLRRSRGQRFCSPRCAGKMNAKKEYGPEGRPSEEAKQAAVETSAVVTPPDQDPAVLVTELAAALICGLQLTSLTIHVDRYRIEIIP